MSGLDFICKKEGFEVRVYGLIIFLMFKVDGMKFGKIVGGVIWLDLDKMILFEFYQFWVNMDDCDVIKYLKYFIFLSKEEIEVLVEKVEIELYKCEVQKVFVEEMIKFVYGDEMLE